METKYPKQRYLTFEKVVREKEKGGYYHIPQNITSTESAFDTIIEISECHRETQEVFGVVSLNTKNKVIGVDIIHKGGVNQSLVLPRDVFKTSLLRGAASIIVFHNHPSEDPNPSPEDKQVTRRLVESGKLIGVQVLDHIIVGNETDFVSLKEKGEM